MNSHLPYGAQRGAARELASKGAFSTRDLADRLKIPRVDAYNVLHEMKELGEVRVAAPAIPGPRGRSQLWRAA